MVGYSLGERGEPGWEDCGIIEQALEQAAFGRSLGPLAAGMLGPWHATKVTKVSGGAPGPWGGMQSIGSGWDAVDRVWAEDR